MDALDLLETQRLVPVVVIEDHLLASDLARALRDAGLGAIEVTLRTPSALQAIEAIARDVPDIVVGAGSVRTGDHFTEIKSRGACFAVSPGSSAQLLKAANITQVPFVPGAETASEIIQLFESGYRLQKFFPAEQSGGLAKLKALSAPLPEVKFFPTGGINGALASKYLEQRFVHCVGGSWFVDAEKLNRRDFEGIRRDAQEALSVCNES